MPEVPPPGLTLPASQPEVLDPSITEITETDAELQTTERLEGFTPVILGLHTKLVNLQDPLIRLFSRRLVIVEAELESASPQERKQLILDKATLERAILGTT